MADAMEMMILSILAPQLHCEWRLPNWEVALLTSVMWCFVHSFLSTINIKSLHIPVEMACFCDGGLNHVRTFSTFNVKFQNIYCINVNKK